MSKSNPKTKLYKYIPEGYLIDTIKMERLYLSDGSNFNDPFELKRIDRKTGEANMIEGLHILCLTSSNKMKLMWSHYTDSHKGACLTVEIPSVHVYPVCYTSKRVFTDSNVDDIINSAKKGNKKNLIKDYTSLSYEKKVALIKDQKWNYEKEYRMVFDHTDEANLIKGTGDDAGKWFLPVKITNVYLGVNFESNKKTELFEICKEKRITVKKMTLSKTNYSLSPKELSL